MPTLIVYGLLIAALLGGVSYIVHEIDQGGYDRHKTELAEETRMAQLRSRERVDTAAGKYEAKRAAIGARERTLAPQIISIVASAPAGDCFTDSMRAVIADDISQHPTEPSGPMPKASEPARRN